MTALERAFQLARSGQVSTVEEIKTSLRRDGYFTNQPNQSQSARRY